MRSGTGPDERSPDSDPARGRTRRWVLRTGGALLMRPTLTVVDATRVLMANGPAGGRLADAKPVGTVAACLDPVAADSWVCELPGASLDR